MSQAESDHRVSPDVRAFMATFAVLLNHRGRKWCKKEGGGLHRRTLASVFPRCLQRALAARVEAAQGGEGPLVANGPSNMEDEKQRPGDIVAGSYKRRPGFQPWFPKDAGDTLRSQHDIDL